VKRTAIVAAVLALSCLAAGPSSVIPGLAGVYKHRHQNGDVTGATYVSEDVLEIVQTGPRAAYVRAVLRFYNGHSCGIHGIAHEQKGGLVYRTKNSYGSGPPVCELRVDRVGREVRLDDGDATCHGFCGMRGTLSDRRFPAASRRSIRYMARLKASREYREAVEEDAQARR
jgi:hypothetical protein